MNNVLRVGSLFSGIGGIELGFETTGFFKTEWFVENDIFCQTILRKHWKETPVYGDIRTINWEALPKVDVLAGGFPCQDISIAKPNAKGIEGERSGLWKSYFEAIRILRPRCALIENVPAITRRGLDVVLSDLASIGYNAEWFDLRHFQVGGFTIRKRIFIIACPREFGLPRLFKERAKEIIGLSPPVPREVMEARHNELCESILLGTNTRFPQRMDRIRGLGNCVIPQIAEVLGKAIKQQLSDSTACLTG